MPVFFHIGGIPMSEFGYRPVGRSGAVKLPDQIHERDDGCRVHPHCLDCPLEACIYDKDVA